MSKEVRFDVGEKIAFSQGDGDKEKMGDCPICGRCVLADFAFDGDGDDFYHPDCIVYETSGNHTSTPSRKLLPGEHLLHTCGDLLCVNPRHLIAVANSDNFHPLVPESARWMIETLGLEVPTKPVACDFRRSKVNGKNGWNAFLAFNGGFSLNLRQLGLPRFASLKDARRLAQEFLPTLEIGANEIIWT